LLDIPLLPIHAPFSLTHLRLLGVKTFYNL
jgi:hypothetical protein